MTLESELIEEKKAKLSRRDFLKLTKTAAVVAGVSALLPACGNAFQQITCKETNPESDKSDIECSVSKKWVIKSEEIDPVIGNEIKAINPTERTIKLDGNGLKKTPSEVASVLNKAAYHILDPKGEEDLKKTFRTMFWVLVTGLGLGMPGLYKLARRIGRSRPESFIVQNKYIPVGGDGGSDGPGDPVEPFDFNWGEHQESIIRKNQETYREKRIYAAFEKDPLADKEAARKTTEAENLISRLVR